MKCNKEALTDFVLPIPSIVLLAVANANSCLGFSASFSWMNMYTDSLQINHKKTNKIHQMVHLGFMKCQKKFI